MKIPTLQGIIDRRILVNFTVDTDLAQNIVPRPFRPKIYNGKAIVGICLIRLKDVRPKRFPAFISIASENAPHRIAVEWEESGQKKEGVYIPRRDTSSCPNHLAGGRLFPGRHHHAKFDVGENNGRYRIAFKSADETFISLHAVKTGAFDTTSIFQTLDNASDFFKTGAVGCSPSAKGYDGLELRTTQRKVEPLNVTAVRSSFFEDETVFPKGSVMFDNALLMTEVAHEWRSAGSKACCA